MQIVFRRSDRAVHLKPSDCSALLEELQHRQIASATARAQSRLKRPQLTVAQSDVRLAILAKGDTEIGADGSGSFADLAQPTFSPRQPN